MSDEPNGEERPTWSRRAVLGLAGAGAVVVAGGAIAAAELGVDGRTRILPTSPLVDAVERRRHRTGVVRRYELAAAPTELDLAGRRASTWAFNATTPHAAIRVNAGDTIHAVVKNGLPDPTTVHWHGVALRNDMDGVPNLTGPAIAPSREFTYRFTAPDPGTYWFHPHVGVQQDRGLYGSLIIEDPHEPLGYDEEAVLVLDDWTDGVGPSPDRVLADLRRSGMPGMGSMMKGSMEGSMGMGSMSPNATGMGTSPAKPLGEDTGDVTYPLHLINGRPTADPDVITTKPGNRIRLRIINAGSDTAYRFAVGGHRLEVVHTDGYPVQPVEVDTLIIGMGERYDVIITAGDGAFPILAQPEGKQGQPAMAVLRSATGATPHPQAHELSGNLLDYSHLAPTPAARLHSGWVDRKLTVDLTMKDGGRRWLINGRAYPDYTPLNLKMGETVGIDYVNHTMMFHPMHLHGHTFALVQDNRPGVRKDTLNVLPMQRLSTVLRADNPGQWLVHCHNTYHGELGMMSALSYVA